MPGNRINTDACFVLVTARLAHAFYRTFTGEGANAPEPMGGVKRL